MKDFEEEVPTRHGQLDERGWEIPDPNPVEMPIGFERPESVEEMIQRMVRGGVSALAREAGYETFEEADNFEIEDEDGFNDPATPYEEEFDPVLGRGITAQEFLDRREYYDMKYREAYQREAEERRKAVLEDSLFEGASAQLGSKQSAEPTPAKEEKPEPGVSAPDA